MLKPEACCLVEGGAALLNGLERQSLLLAVSGGPDSMALMALVARWAASLDVSPMVRVVTVDHGLRAEARGEAEMVANAAQAVGLLHRILTWDGPKPKSRIQESARDARYALIGAHALEIGATHLLTGHHADDQAETVLLRLARGSGVKGLAGMRRETVLPSGLVLVRPFLDVPKADLVAFCRTERIVYADDPSNADPTYARARLRGQAEARAALGLDTATLTRLARRMAEADDALEVEVDRIEGLIAPNRSLGRYHGSLAAARHAEDAILSRLIARAIDHVVPGAGWQRLDRLEALTRALRQALTHGERHHATLGGARIVLSRDTMVEIVPEPLRRRGRPLSPGG